MTSFKSHAELLIEPYVGWQQQNHEVISTNISPKPAKYELQSPVFGLRVGLFLKGFVLGIDYERGSGHLNETESNGVSHLADNVTQESEFLNAVVGFSLKGKWRFTYEPGIETKMTRKWDTGSAQYKEGTMHRFAIQYQPFKWGAVMVRYSQWKPEQYKSAFAQEFRDISIMYSKYDIQIYEVLISIPILY